MSCDEHKRNIKGFHGAGIPCACCREVVKKKATRLARRRLRQQDRKRFKENC